MTKSPHPPLRIHTHTHKVARPKKRCPLTMPAVSGLCSGTGPRPMEAGEGSTHTNIGERGPDRPRRRARQPEPAAICLFNEG